MQPPPPSVTSVSIEPPVPDKLPPQPGQEEFYRRPDNWPGRGYLVRYVGETIHKAQNTPLNIRHDVIVERRVIGRLLGKGGRDLEAMQLCSGAQIFIIDKYPPPEEGDDHRLLVLIGKPDQVRLAKSKVDVVLERAREELPPLPPPKSMNWRPVPTVGNDERGSDAWVNLPEGGGSGKRPREEDEFGPPGPSGPPRQPLAYDGALPVGEGYGPGHGPGYVPSAAIGPTAGPPPRPPPPPRYVDGFDARPIPPPPPGGPPSRGY